jgi:hypothetical protein
MRRTSSADHSIARRNFLAGCVVGLVSAALADTPLGAQPAPRSAGPASLKLIEDLVAANRILADQGVLDGYGHVSARHDRDPGGISSPARWLPSW